VGLWNCIRLAAGDGPIPVFTACSLRCDTGTVHTIAESPLESPLALDSLLEFLPCQSAGEVPLAASVLEASNIV